MAINLSKGSGIQLKKNEQLLKQITLGCGWKSNRGGLFGLGSLGADIDIDASVFAYKGSRLVDKCYFGKQQMFNKRGELIAQSSGDNRTGGNGKTDDERIKINIENIGDYADSLYLVLNIYRGVEQRQYFDKVKDSYVKVYDDNMNVMAQFDLNEDYAGKTGVVVGKLVKVNGVFEFIAIGDGECVQGLGDLAGACLKY